MVYAALSTVGSGGRTIPKVQLQGFALARAHPDPLDTSRFAAAERDDLLVTNLPAVRLAELPVTGRTTSTWMQWIGAI